MTHLPKIALVVITRNEENLIGQCLKSAAFCEEMIVVDSFSTDATVDIARAAGATVFQREFSGYIAQKQFALDQAHADWILSLDADEQATYALREEIMRAIHAPDALAGYEIRRILFHLGHYYVHGIYPDYHLRLFQREGARFGGREPHAKAVVSGPTGRLKAPILHFSYRDIADHIATMNRLTSQAAVEGKPGAAVVFKMLANPIWRFFNFYILRGGFLDGAHGLYAAMAAAFYVFQKYAKLYERRLNRRYVGDRDG